ncbi:MAG: ornithine--oxo-acid transaminase [Promethearchaeota archaeon]
MLKQNDSKTTELTGKDKELTNKEKNLINLEETYGSHGYHPISVVIEKGEGVWVWDVNGKKYLDCLSAYSALNHGHRHPKIVNALKEQSDKLTLTSRAFYNNKLGPFLKKICEFCDMEMALPMNSGAEAVETGIKIARRWGYRIKKVEPNKAEIIVCENNFHGRTTTIVGFSSDPNSYEDFGPATPGFIKVPFNDANALKKAITPNTVGFLVEPILGEAGVIIPDEGYLKNIREICTKNNVLLILDEIQTGLGRTGKKFAFQYEGIKPDILLLGKALSGGMLPVSAAVSSKEIMEVITPGSHGSTFGGNPIASAVGIAALKVLEDEKLPERAAEMGNYFINELRKIKDKRIKEVRGKGLLIAIEFNENIRYLTENFMQNGILVKDTHEFIIRFAPPLVIDRKTIDWAISIIKKTLKE